MILNGFYTYSLYLQYFIYMEHEKENEDHLKYLGEPISDINSLGNIFSEEELKIINKYGAWMEALADRKIEPITTEQKTEIRKIPQKIKDYIERHLLDIESRDDISIKEKSDKIIHLFCATCAAISIQPIPFADTFVLTPLQAYMATRLASIHGISVTKASAWENVTDLGKVIGLGLLAQQVALGLYKIGLPGLSGLTTIPLVYALTYGIGQLLNEMYLRRSKNKDKMTEKEIKEMWKKMKKEGLNFGKQKTDEIKSNKNIFKK